MDTARVSAKGQVTIPLRVRRAAHVGEGDVLMFTVGPEGAILATRLQPHAELDALSATFSEWDSDEDDRAFRGL